MLAIGTIQIATRIDEINYDELECLRTVEDLDSFDAKDGKIVKYIGDDPKYKKGFDYMCVIEDGNKTWIPIISENGQVQVDWNQVDINATDYIKNKPDLSNFASKEELNNKADKSEIPDTSQFAKKSDIPDTSKFLTKDDIPEIPSIPDLSDIRAELENKADLSLLNNKVDVDALDDYATKNDLDNLATKNDLANKANLSDIVTNYNDLSDKPTKLSDFINDLPDPLTDLTFAYNKEDVTLEIKNGDTLITSIGVADFVKDGMINSVELNYNVLTITFNTDAGKQPINIDLSNIVPSLDGYATEQYVDDSLDEINEALKKVVNGETPVSKEYTAGDGININDSVISADTTVLATKKDLEGIPTWEDIPNPNLFATKEEIKLKADKTEIPDVSGFATKDEIPTVPENVSAFNNDAGYLTEHQSLEEYALKKDIKFYNNPIQTCDYIETAAGNENDVYMPTIGSEQYPKGECFKNTKTIVSDETYQYVYTFDNAVYEESKGAIKNQISYNDSNGSKNIQYLCYYKVLEDGKKDTNEYIELFYFNDIYNLAFIGAEVLVYTRDSNTRITKTIIDITNSSTSSKYITEILTSDNTRYAPNSLVPYSYYRYRYITDNNITIYGNSNSNYPYLINGVFLVEYEDSNIIRNINITTCLKRESNVRLTITKTTWEAISNTNTTNNNNYIAGTGINIIDNTISIDEELIATKSELNNKANVSDIPSLDGYATEEYVNNAIANAGGNNEPVSGNYLKLVDDLDTYEGTDGEIVKYSGSTNDKYIQGADYVYHEVSTVILPANNKCWSVSNKSLSEDYTDLVPTLFTYKPTKNLTLSLFKRTYTDTMGGVKQTFTEYVAVDLNNLTYVITKKFTNTSDYGGYVSYSTPTLTNNTLSVTYNYVTNTYNFVGNITPFDKTYTYNKNICYTYNPTISENHNNWLIACIVDSNNNMKWATNNYSIVFSSSATTTSTIECTISDGEKYTLTDFCKRALNIE